MSIYSHAYQLTGNERYRQIVDAMVAFMSREMLDPGGAYYAALDAESEQVEGKYYRWTKEQIATLLGDRYDVFAEIYGLTHPPNFDDQYYVLQLERPLAETAEQRSLTLAALDASCSHHGIRCCRPATAVFAL